MEIPVQDLIKDITFKTSRSSGKGGQNVNKVATKAELNFDLNSTQLFTDKQKQQIQNKLKNKLIGDNIIQVVCEEERSQLQNKERAVQKLVVLLTNALKEQKVRKATRPKKSAIEQRLRNKQQQAIKKLNRRNIFD
ncbi:alternative ribosome rescue aminoacyl-tRNA hydrolase ArfB [Rubrolithibacter danxiaensis]|uniref:alternative ribosome rescue aminoacyl-tRNA hydrolase ArfB n=1 Tax=Rubrolithibacter danxiaensis TaxID=3390805 RepID=UPI003BF78246